MIGKKYTSLSDGRVVEVKDIFEDIVILGDNSKIKTSRLFDKNYFEEYIDPKSFFSNQYLLDSFAQKIKQIPDEVIQKMGSEKSQSINESLNQEDNFRPRFDDVAVLPADPELEKLELMRKYGIQNNESIEDPHLKAQKQLEQFKSLLEDIEEENEEILKIEVQNEDEEQIINYQQEKVKNIEIQQKVEDPIITMFKNVKRNKDFKMTLDIVGQIPRPDFIEMMEDSYNTSIIEFIADEFTSKLLNDPSMIKEKIIEEIKKIVYGQEISKTPEVVKTPQKTTRQSREKKTSIK